MFYRILVLPLLLFPTVLFAQQQPTAAEAAFIYELNRARQNPQRYQTEQSLGTILNGVAAQPPLAMNQHLVQSARFHTTEMASDIGTGTGYFAHTSAVTGDQPNKMARDAGYPLDPALPNAANNIESLAANGSSGPGVSYSPGAALRLLIEDLGVPGAGHRVHLLAMNAFNQTFREVGTGYSQGLHWANPSPASGAYWAIHTGRRDPNLFWLTGLVYSDTNGNGRYDQGEGLSGVTVSATGAMTTSVQTTSGGVWSMQATNGTVNLTCSGGSFVGTSTKTVVVASANREIDFCSGKPAGELDFEYQAVGGGRVVNVTASSLVFTSVGAGVPSAEQSYSVSGARLTGNVTITAPTEFEVSTTSGSGFTATLNLSPAAGTLAATTIYVRYTPASGAASGAITHASSGANTAVVNVSGTLITTPTIFANPSSLNLAAARMGVTSAEQTYTVSGYNLAANITITAPSQFEVSITTGTGFSGGLTLNHTAGTVNPTTIYARYNPSALGGSGNITHVAGAASTNVAVAGTVTNAPAFTAMPNALTLISPTGGGPSAEQTFVIQGQYLAGAINVTAPAGFDMSLTSGSGYVTSFNLTPAAGVVAATTVYVRYLGGAPSASGNVDCTSSLAASQQVALSGSIAPPPAITVSTTSLGMNSPNIGVPSGERTFTVSGVNLVGAVTVTASAEFQVSLSSGAGFGSSVNLPPTGGTLAATTVFVRFVPTAGDLTGTATATSPAATTRVVNLFGTVGGSGSGSGGSTDSGGGCAAGAPGAIWLLALLAPAAAVLRRRRA